jgi:hypothetical protein
MDLSNNEITDKIHNQEFIEIPGDGHETKTIFIQSAGFTMNNKFCFYCYDSNKKNGSLIYLNRLTVRKLIYTGKI